jgi:hypothetical protein
MKNDVRVRRLELDDLNDNALDSFEREQQTRMIRVVVDGAYTEKAFSYDEDWSLDKKRDIVRQLRACIEHGGVVIGALDANSIMGFANVEAKRFAAVTNMSSAGRRQSRSDRHHFIFA